MISYLKKLWKGEEKLWKVFWLWGILGILISHMLIINFHQKYPYLVVVFSIYPIFAGVLIWINSKSFKSIIFIMAKIFSALVIGYFSFLSFIVLRSLF